MKKALLIIGMIIIFFAGCKKDDILEASRVEMKDVTMERGWEHVKMSGEYSYPQALEGMKIIVSSNENMGESVEYVCALEGKKFDVTIDNLEAGVTYYYRYEYDNGYDKARGDKANFVTVGKPIVVTNNIVNVTKNSAVLSGSVTNNDVENKINARGLCWSKNANPTISGSHNNNGSSSGTGTSSFTYNLSYLESNTKYYVRAYAKTDWGVVYGEEKSFVTKGEEPEVPEVPNENGYEYVDLGLPSGLNWATCNVGANSPEAYGDYFAWGEIKTKTSYSSSNYLNNGKQMNDISGNSKYDVATANWGGNWRMPTKAEINELVTNCTWTWTTQNGVNGYNIKSKTNANSIFLPAAGHRHNTSHYYVGEDGHYWSSTPVEDDNIYIYNIVLFAANYGVNSAFNRIFGAPVRPVFGGNFTGPEEQPEDEPEQPEIVLPTVTTNSVTNITSNSATCGGNVTSDGNGTVTARGICWSETSEPKINNLYSEESNDGTGIGSFTSSMTNLKANTTYYVRAYATNEAGTVYGEVKSFKTLEEEPEETISGTENGHDYVDLGLPSGLKWATCNVGASTSTDYGHYYAWGEITTKTEYTEDNSLTYGKQMNDISGNSQYDAATANWGGTWRMPTYDELNELRNKCTWTWTTQNGVNGYNVEGPNGNSIFLPAAGYRDGSSLHGAGGIGFYWSSAPYKHDVGYAFSLSFLSDLHRMGEYFRYYGRSVRPVFGGNFEGPEEQPEEPETPSANQSFTVKGVTFTMISVEGGTFKMGAQSSDSGGDNYDSDAYSKESPVHDVTLSSYYIGETEVTQELWEAVMGSNPSEFSGSQKPVESISWNDCQEFITKLNELTSKNFRLPTEAEWEYAARGGNKSNGYKYSGSNTIGNVSWYTDNSSSTTHDVKTKQANELGIYDMSGNVWEWCQDWYESYSSGSQTDPTGPTSGSYRVLRGGSWGFNARYCRVSDRSDYGPGYSSNSYGFRLILQELQ